ncbi:MAG: sulfatase-like hydrolase/transferase [Aestuariivirga sp.]
MNHTKSWQAPLIAVVAYCLFAIILVILIQNLPDGHFGPVLTITICVALSGSFYFILPSRWTFLFAPLFVWGLYFVLDQVNVQKSGLTSFPLTATDLRAFFDNPLGFLIVLGSPEWTYFALQYISYVLAFLIILGAIFALPRVAPKRVLLVSLGVVARIMIVGFALLTLNTSIVNAVSTYVSSHNEIAAWEGSGVVLLSKKVGILGFLSYSQHIEGVDRDNFLTYIPKQAPPPREEVEKSVNKFVINSQLDGVLPNIIIVHAESTFDPNDVLNLVSPVTNSLFYTYPGATDDPKVNFRGPAIVNTIGGGSWISEFEVINGIDSRLFGAAGRYTHSALSSFSRHTFPRYLQERGYEIATYQPGDGTFFNAEKAYKLYGFQHFYGRSYMSSVDSDPDIVRSALAVPAIDPNAPFLKFIILIENHSPHTCENLSSAQHDKVDLAGNPSREHTCAVKEYVRRAHSTEQAVAIARDYLEAEQTRTGRPYVIAIYGDHQPFSFTGGGGINYDIGLDFSEFRKDGTYRKTIVEFISSKDNPLICCGKASIPLTLVPSMLSAYVAKSISELYLPENFYQIDHCGSDWIGHLTGDIGEFGYNSGPLKSSRGDCSSYETLIAAYKLSNVIGYPDTRNRSPENLDSVSVALLHPSSESNSTVQNVLTQLAVSVGLNTSEKNQMERSNQITIISSGTRFGEPPKADVIIDGKPIGGFILEKAPDNSVKKVDYSDVLANSQKFDFSVSECPHTVEIRFLNDAWAGTGQTGDTNIYLTSVMLNGIILPFSNAKFSPPHAGGFENDKLLEFWSNGSVFLQADENSTCH